MCYSGFPTATATPTIAQLYQNTMPLRSSINYQITSENMRLQNNPRPSDVVCARGRQFWNHPGNQHYRKLIDDAAAKYQAARNKMEKSLVVLDVIERVHQANGRFIKKQRKGGPWVEVDEIFARDKCTQSFRDSLCTVYRSATKTKRARRSRQDKQFHGVIDRIVRSNPSLLQQVESLSQRVSLLNSNKLAVSDDIMLELFLQANVNMLETMKNDPSMHQKLQQDTSSVNLEWGYSHLDLVHAIEDEDMSIMSDIIPQTQNMEQIYHPVPTLINMYR